MLLHLVESHSQLGSFLSVKPSFLSTLQIALPVTVAPNVALTSCTISWSNIPGFCRTRLNINNLTGSVIILKAFSVRYGCLLVVPTGCRKRVYDSNIEVLSYMRSKIIESLALPHHSLSQILPCDSGCNPVKLQDLRKIQ